MPASTPTTKWPKVLPPLTPEQKRISDDFMKIWHEVLARRFWIFEELAPWFTIEARSYFPLKVYPLSGAISVSASPLGRAPSPSPAEVGPSPDVHLWREERD